MEFGFRILVVSGTQDFKVQDSGCHSKNSLDFGFHNSAKISRIAEPGYPFMRRIVVGLIIFSSSRRNLFAITEISEHC